MTLPHRIAACLVIAAQVILALAVPATAVHGTVSARDHRHDEVACGGHAVAPETAIGCRSPAGTWVLGFGSEGHRDVTCDHGSCDQGGFDCGDGHSHLHVANVDEIGDGSRRQLLPPVTVCSILDGVAVPAALGPAGIPGAGRDRVPRPPPSSRQALGSVVLVV